MPKEVLKGVHAGRRDFLKTTTMAGMAATLPGTVLQNSERIVKTGNTGNRRKLLLLSGYPKAYERFIESVKSIKEFEFTVVSIQPDYQKPQEILKTIQSVAPLRLLGPNAPALPRNIRDYHGMGRGVTPEVSFPPDLEVTMGGFSKDLKEFVMWPGRIQAGIMDTDRLSYNQTLPEFKNMRRYCSNRAELKIKEADAFQRKIVGVHHVMVAGIYTKDIREEMIRLNANVTGPIDSLPPV